MSSGTKTIVVVMGALASCALFPSLGDLDRGGGEGGVDAAADVDAATINCGSFACRVGAEVCCVSLATGPTGCAATNVGCPNGEMTVPCDDSLDCAALGSPNAYCCVATSSDTVATSVSCQATCTIAYGTSTRLCNPDSGIDPCAATSCVVSTKTLPGMFICK